jgi:hypothetical protein
VNGAISCFLGLAPLCFDDTSSADFLFRLQPGDPQRFLPKPGGGTAIYQTVITDAWPMWGADLYMGDTGPPGTDGFCNQSNTYAGSPNASCGGGPPTAQGPANGTSWGQTDLEAWRLLADCSTESRCEATCPGVQTCTPDGVYYCCDVCTGTHSCASNPGLSDCACHV